jgi:hypothetical protein
MMSDATVGSDFSVNVSFHGKPITRARVVLYKEISASGTGVVATARTDSRGTARFRAIPSGSYYPDSPDGLLFRSDSLLIKVEAGHDSSEKAEVEWPSNPIAVRNLQGRFNIAEEVNGSELPLRNTGLKLLDVYTAMLIESVQTDANGDFEFTTKDPGIYALRLTLPLKGEPGSEDRDLAIELDPAAKEGSIPEMTVVQSDCAGVQLLRRSETGDGWEEQ